MVMDSLTPMSRRRFLKTAGTTAAVSILLKGCLGNPPDSSTSGESTGTSPTAPAISLSAEQTPETTAIKLGYIPIVEAAGLIIAKEKGFFAQYGMTEVELSKQANWASARDNVTIGSTGGGIDGGQWQMPMPHLITEGIVTNGTKVPIIWNSDLSPSPPPLPWWWPRKKAFSKNTALMRFPWCGKPVGAALWMAWPGVT